MKVRAIQVALFLVDLLPLSTSLLVNSHDFSPKLRSTISLRGGSLDAPRNKARNSRSQTLASSKLDVNHGWKIEKTFETLEPGPAYVQPLQGQSSPYRLSLISGASNGSATSTSKSSTYHATIPMPSQALSATLARSRRWSLPSVLSKMGGRFELLLFLTYMCAMIAITTPTVLLPEIAADPTSHMLSAGSMPTMSQSSAFVAKVASLSTIGGGLGKFINGFAVQAIGARSAARLYFLGLASSSALFSTTTSLHGPFLASMEFFSSIQWTAMCMIVATAYQNSPEKFSRGIAALSLSSTLGSLLTKLVFSAMLQQLHWRQVGLLGASAAILGAVIVHTLLSDRDCMGETERRRAAIRSKVGLKPTSSKDKTGLSFTKIRSSVTHVLGNRVFWLVGLGHAMGFLARRSDQLLGNFFQATAQLPSYVCGGLTASVTLGFINGISQGKKFYDLDNDSEKAVFIKRGYNYAAVASMGLALCAVPTITAVVGPQVVASLIALMSGAMASAIAFQFYQIPAKCSTLFDENSRAVCVSFLDGIGFLVSGPVWYLVGKIISTYGWSAAWLLIAGLLSIGGVVMSKALPTVMEFDKLEE